VEDQPHLKDMTVEVIGVGTISVRDVGFMLIVTLRKTIVNYVGL
jgi:3-keto-L-gulonate-6-phosphate decarboxylase